jgi:hypothetical protein
LEGQKLPSKMRFSSAPESAFRRLEKLPKNLIYSTA